MNAEDIESEKAHLKKDIIGVEENLFNVLLISYLNFLFPIHHFTEHILTSKTKRLAAEVSVDYYNELVPFIITLWL